jgi:hypothetical protein
LPIDDAALVATMIAICDEFEAYGYRSKSKASRFRQSFPAIGLNSGRQ